MHIVRDQGVRRRAGILSTWALYRRLCTGVDAAALLQGSIHR